MRVVGLLVFTIITFASSNGYYWTAGNHLHLQVERNNEVLRLGDNNRNLILALLANMTRIIDDANKQILLLANEVDNIYQDLLITTLQKIQTLVNEAISRIREEVRVSGQVLQVCILESGLTNVPVLLVNDLRECALGRIDEAYTLINSIIMDVNKALQIIRSLESRLGVCGWNITCYTDLLADVNKAVVDLPAQIVKDVDRIRMLVTTLTGSLQSCATTELTQAAVLIAQDVAAIRNCTQQVLNQNQEMVTVPSLDIRVDSEPMPLALHRISL